MYFNNKGFNLVELMAVIAIVGIMAVIGIPKYNNYRIKAFQAEAKTQLVAIHTAERAFHLEYNGYHSSLQVIGYAPHGLARYNVGFGVAGPTPALAPVENVFINSKAICGGPFGSGTDPNCSLIIDTPNLVVGATVTANTYTAVAMGYDDLMVAQQANPSTLSIVSNMILGPQANAASSSGLFPTSVIDGWYMTESNRMTNVKMIANCANSDSCTISTDPASPTSSN